LSSFRIEPLAAALSGWVNQLLKEEWGSTDIVVREEVIDASGLPGYVALIDSDPAGLITYRIENETCGFVTLNSLAEKRGIGNGLLNAVINTAFAKGCNIIRLVTTNDNTDALKFYQKRGFKITQYRFNAIEKSRKLKPSIPIIGQDGIVISDEIELELTLDKYLARS